MTKRSSIEDAVFWLAITSLTGVIVYLLATAALNAQSATIRWASISGILIAVASMFYFGYWDAMSRSSRR